MAHHDNEPRTPNFWPVLVLLFAVMTMFTALYAINALIAEPPRPAFWSCVSALFFLLATCASLVKSVGRG